MSTAQIINLIASKYPRFYICDHMGSDYEVVNHIAGEDIPSGIYKVRGVGGLRTEYRRVVRHVHDSGLVYWDVGDSVSFLQRLFNQ